MSVNLPQFECWVPEHGEGPDDADTIGAHDAEEAAEGIAERFFALGDPFANIVVMVRDQHGLTVSVDVEVEYIPSFSGRAQSHKAMKDHSATRFIPDPQNEDA